MTHITDVGTEAQRGKTAGIQGQSVLTPEHIPLTPNLTPIKALYTRWQNGICLPVCKWQASFLLCKKTGKRILLFGKNEYKLLFNLPDLLLLIF